MDEAALQGLRVLGIRGFRFFFRGSALQGSGCKDFRDSGFRFHDTRP